MTTAPHILVIGAGSVGRRHLRNLAALGCVLSAADPRADRISEAVGEVTLAREFTDMDAARAAMAHFDGVVIASPPSVHVDQCIAAIRAGVPVLLEKPVSPDLARARRLAAEIDANPGASLLLGYTYRWWPPLQRFRERLAAGEIGTPLHARFVMSAHLADWHPWERYQEFFMASRELGGGALLDESHFLDLMIWFFGMPDEVYARVERLSALEIETDDNVDMVASFGDLRVAMHLDLFGRPHEKYISVAGDKGTLEWSFEPNRVRLGTGMEQEWDEECFDFERNDMFVGVAREFLALVAGDLAEPTCTIKDGVDVMRIVEACRQSTASRATVTLEKELGHDARG